VSRRLIGDAEHFWQKRHYDLNIRNHRQFGEKLRYIHRNPVKRGLCEGAEDWEWSSFLHYATGTRDAWRSNRNGRRQGANEQREQSIQRSCCPTQAKTGLEWATRPPHRCYITSVSPNRRIPLQCSPTRPTLRTEPEKGLARRVLFFCTNRSQDPLRENYAAQLFQIRDASASRAPRPLPGTLSSELCALCGEVLKNAQFHGHFRIEEGDVKLDNILSPLKSMRVGVP
jgi:hypothetical protein